MSILGKVQVEHRVTCLTNHRADQLRSRVSDGTVLRGDWSKEVTLCST